MYRTCRDVCALLVVMLPLVEGDRDCCSLCVIGLRHYRRIIALSVFHGGSVEQDVHRGSTRVVSILLAYHSA